MQSFFTVSVLVMLIFASSFASVINVPSDQSTIQAGIDIAAVGDTVLVADGTYLENINFLGKAITVASHFTIDGDTTHISNTIIDGSQYNNADSAAVVSFVLGEDTTSVLNGFTITGGEGSYFSLWNASAGGGIYILHGAKIINNHIINNSVDNIVGASGGGGIFINTGYSTTQDNGNVIIKNNLIANNLASGYTFITGGGIVISGFGNTIIPNNTIKNNRVVSTSPIYTLSSGGGLFTMDYNTVIVNNVIAGNEAPKGAGVAAWGNRNGHNFRLINNTIVANRASDKGGGLYVLNGHCTAKNNIIWDNTAPEDPDIYYRGELNISYSITQDSLPGIGNLYATDPLFEDAEYHLSDSSPAIDAGNPESRFNDPADPNNPSIPLWPAKGTLRADMGAFGGNDTVNVEIEDYLVKQNFLYKQFSNMHYRFAYPLNYDSTAVYPLTIVLHGGGSEGTDNERHLLTGLYWRINVEHYGYNEFTIVPQAPLGWGINNDLITVYNIIRNTIENFSIDTTKIVVTGFSRGGGGTWQLLNLYPEFFSAAIPIAGLDVGFGEIKHVPVWVNHGTDDGNVSVTFSRNYINKFENTGLTAVYAEDSSDVQISAAINNNARLFYSEFVGARHNIRRDAWDNNFLYEWLEKQSRPLISPINSNVNKIFLIVNQDSVRFRTEFSNPHNFQKEDTLIVENFNREILRHIILYDDGLHGDSLAQDGIWGNYLSPFQIEDNYRLGIQLENTDRQEEFFFNDLAAFTTVGPIVFADYTITSSDTIPHDTDKLKFEFTLLNIGSTATATNITSQIVALDTFSIITPIPAPPEYGDIQPGSTAVGNQRQYIKFDLGVEDSINVKFKIDISSNGYLFWSDTFSVFVYKDPLGIDTKDENLPTEFTLKQNYPNPFNPNTSIEFSIPKQEFVTLKIYNLLGQEVTTLVSDRLKAGNYNYIWNAGTLASGVYFYELEVGDFVETRKMILLR
jgi:hypothetical protein